MKQFGKILKFELKSYFQNKTFVTVTLVIVLILAAVMFFPRLSALFGDDPHGTSGNIPVMLVKTEDSSSAALIKESFSNAFDGYNVQISSDKTESIKEKIISGEAECAFVIEDATKYTYYVNNLTMYDDNSALANIILQRVYQLSAMTASGIDPQNAVDIMNVQIEGNIENLGKDQIQNFFYTYVMIFALYMVILLYGQMVSMNVATEKSSRAMEVLITSANPVSMMFGKVLASCIAGLAQLLAIFGSALLFYNINEGFWGGNEIVNSMFDIPPELLLYMLIFFLLGFLIYAFLFGAVSSTVSKLEDINTAVQPITFLFLFGFIVVVISMSSGSVDNTLMKVCSYIPFTSPMAMFTRIAMSTVPVWEILTSIAILAVSAVGIGILSAKIYRVGVLLYGNKPKLGTVLKSVWKA